MLVALASHQRRVELRVKSLEVRRGRARVELDPVVFAVRSRDVAVEAHGDRVSNASHRSPPSLPRRAFAPPPFPLLISRGRPTALRRLRPLARRGESLREVPGMAFEILGAIPAGAVERVLWLLDDRGARGDGSREVLLDVVDVDVEVVRRVTQRPRALEVGPRAAEHEQRLAELHFSVI